MEGFQGPALLPILSPFSALTGCYGPSPVLLGE